MEFLPNIMLIGQMRTGKDTIYKILEEEGFYVKRVAFGDVMKEKFYELFPQYKKRPKPIKEIVHFGQTLRVIDPDIWVNLTIGGLKVDDLMRDQYGLPAPSLVFTDVRQWNEYKACREQGCIAIRVHSQDGIKAQRMRVLGEEVNPDLFTAGTEEELKSFPHEYSIWNNGSFEGLRAQIKAIVLDIAAKDL